MNGKLFIVEGSTKSGKNTLCEQLAQKGFVVIRGIPSQNPLENSDLEPEAKAIIGDTVFNFKYDLTLPGQLRDQIIDKFTYAADIQHVAARLMREQGKTIILNRSAISLTALMKLTSKFIEPQDPEAALSLSTKSEGFVDTLLPKIDGIILMTRPFTGMVGKEREGMSGLEEKEAQLICAIARSLSQERNIPLLELDANNQSPEQEMALAQEFISKSSI